MKKLISAILAAALALSLVACSSESTTEEATTEGDGTWEFKNRIEIMVPAGEGGGLDTTIRKFATYLQDELGTTVTITNRSGGSGVTGYTWSNNSKNDGYAFQFTAPSSIIADAQGNFSFPLMEEIIPVSGLVMAEGMLFANPNLPFTTAEEFIAYAKENPGEVSIAVDTPNGISGAIVAEFERNAGIELQWITSESGQDIISVIAGDIDLAINTWSDSGAYAESGDVIPLLALATQPNPVYSHVPCTADLGIETTLGYYRVLTAMGDTPQEAVDALEAAVHKVATENQEWIEWINQNGMTNDYLWTSEELATVLADTHASAAALAE